MKITIKKNLVGYSVLRDGEAVATLCGGNLGRILAIECARTVATIGMADVYEIEADEAEAAKLKAAITGGRI